MIKRYRNGDADIRALERAYFDDPEDPIAYEALLAARFRAGLSVDDPKALPTNDETRAVLIQALERVIERDPNDIRSYAVLISEKLRAGSIPRNRVTMAARLGHEPSRIAAPEWDGINPGAFMTDLIPLAIYVLNGREAVMFGADCVEHVLKRSFGNYYPNDNRPAAALAGARAWVAKPSRKAFSDAITAAGAVDEVTEEIYENNNRAAYAAWAASLVARCSQGNIADAVLTALDASGRSTRELRWQQEQLIRYLIGEIKVTPPILPIKRRTKS